MENKNSKAESYFEAAQKVSRQKAPEHLYDQIRLATKAQVISMVPGRWLVAVAAALLALSLLNIQALKKSQITDFQKEELKSLLLPDSYQLY